MQFALSGNSRVSTIDVVGHLGNGRLGSQAWGETSKHWPSTGSLPCLFTDKEGNSVWLYYSVVGISLEIFYHSRSTSSNLVVFVKLLSP